MAQAWEYSNQLMLIIPAHAKVNLGVSVLSRRADGLHALASVLVPIDWHDLLTLRPAGRGDVTVGHWRDEAGMAPPAKEDLSLVAARLLLGGTGCGVRIDIVKRIPTRAGLGGGSADAAAVLRGLRSTLDIGKGALAALAFQLGADVPALLYGGASRVGGAGEVLEPQPMLDLNLAVAMTGESSTPATFAALRPEEYRGSDRIDALSATLAAGQPPRDELLGSDLEAAAVRAHPQLGRSLARLRSATGLAWPLTGSGGACFQLCPTAIDAEAAAAAARAAGIPARACRSVTAVAR